MKVRDEYKAGRHTIRLIEENGEWRIEESVRRSNRTPEHSRDRNYKDIFTTETAARRCFAEEASTVRRSYLVLVGG